MSDGGRSPLEQHNDDLYSHWPMIRRLQQEYVTVRESFENRLNALEAFKAQATLLGGLGAILLGAVAALVVTHWK